jgi:hypothetical protein
VTTTKTLDAKKERELRALLAARRGCPNLPDGEVVPDEEPDFTIITADGKVGIELRELLPQPRNLWLKSPLAEQRLHEDVVRGAERQYYANPNAFPVKVTAYFWAIEKGKSRAREMTDGLAAFVQAHCHDANPVATFDWRPDLPDGFSVISIATPRDSSSWYTGASVNITLDDIRQQIATAIESKNALLPRYRANLPNAPVWLLLHSCAVISRGVPIPHGIRDWIFPCGFDRVLFYSSLSGTVEEILRAGGQ